MLTKIVNGKVVNCSPEDEALIRSEWAANEKKQSDFDAQFAYIEKRRSAYPPVQDYLDGIVNNDPMQIKKYIDDCQAVKNKYPKPSKE